MKSRLHTRHPWRQPASWRSLALLLGLCLALAFALPRVAAGDPQVLSWEGTTNVFLDPGVPCALGARSSSGLPVSLKVEAGPAKLADGMLTVTGAGTVLVSAEQAGDAMYSAARITRRFNMLHAGFSEAASNVPLHSGSRIQIVDKYAFLTVPGPWVPGTPRTGDLRVLDITDLANPVPVATLSVEGSIGSVEIAGDRACLSVEFRDGTNPSLPGAVHMLDISRPKQPTRLGTFEAARYVQKIRMAGNLLYITEAGYGDRPGDGLEIVDLSQPSNPVKIGGFGSGLNFSDIEIVGSTAYVTDYENGLAILDIQNPTNPIRKDSGILHGVLGVVTVFGGVAYVTGDLDGKRGVHVVDVTDSSRPQLIRSVAIAELWGRVQVIGSHAYVQAGRPPNKATGSITRIHAFDITDPTDPVDVGYYENPNAFTGFNIIGGSIYLGLEVSMYAPPFAADVPTITLRFGRPQNLKHTLPEFVPFTGSAISNLVSSGTALPITFTVLNGPARVENGQLRLKALGPVTVQADQAGDATYLPAVDQWTFTISPPALGLRRSADGLEAFWPDGLTGLRLQQAGGLSSAGAWKDVEGERIRANGEERVRITSGNPRQFFRLQGP